MKPSTHADILKLQDLNKLDLNEANARRFTNHLHKCFPNGWEKNQLAQNEVNKFLAKLNSIDEIWTSDIRNALQESQSMRSSLAVEVSPRPVANPDGGRNNSYENIVCVVERPDGEYRRMYEYVLGASKYQVPKGDINLYYFQAYFNQLNDTSYAVDGVWGNDSNKMVHTDIFATQWLLGELGAKGKNGKTLAMDGKIGPDTRDALKKYFNGDVVVSTPRTVGTAPEIVVGVPEAVVVVPIVKPTLQTIGVTGAQASTLAASTIKGYPDIDAIKLWQKEHLIGIDGVLGAETYLEMDAERILTGMRSNKENFIFANQTEILHIFQFGNPRGRSVLGVIAEIGSFRNTFDNTAGRFNSFFKKLDIFLGNPEVNPYIAEVKRDAEVIMKSHDGDGFLGDIPKLVSGELSIPDYIDRYKGPAAIVMMLAYIFFGSKIPGMKDMPGSGSIFTRLGLAGLFLAGGGMKLANWGLDAAVKGGENMSAYIKTPEVQKKFLDTKDGTISFIMSLPDTIKSLSLPDFDTDKIGKKYDEILTKFASRQNTLLGTDGEKMIQDESFVTLHTTLFKDKKFLNTSREDISKITDKNSLGEYLSEEGKTQIGTTITDKEIQAFVLYFIQEEMSDGTDFVYQIFYTSKAIDLANDTIAMGVTNYNIHNPEQNKIVLDGFSDIIKLSTSSIALRDAAMKLQRAAQNGDVSDFNVDNFPSITDEKEKTQLKELRDTIHHIQTAQKNIASHTQKIQDIHLATGNQLPETELTLTDKLDRIDKIQAYIQELKTEIGEKKNGITTKGFDWDSFDAAYQSKRLEILRAASEIEGLEIIGGIVIEDELGKAENLKYAYEQQQEIETQLGKLTDLPTGKTNMIELQKWVKINADTLEKLGVIKFELEGKKPEEGTLEFELLSKIKLASDRVSKQAQDIFNKLVSDAHRDISQLETDISKIPGDTKDFKSYKRARTKLETISNRYDVIVSGIVSSWSSKTSRNIEQYLGNLVNGGKTDLDGELDDDNSFVNLHKILGGVTIIDLKTTESLMKDKILELEAQLDVSSLNLGSLDVSKVKDIMSMKQSLTESSEIVDMFLSDTLRENKLQKIREEVSKVEAAFIVAIGNEKKSVELDKLFALYETDFRDFLRVKGVVIGTWYTRYFNSEDKVKDAYEVQRGKLDKSQHELLRHTYFESRKGTQDEFRQIPLIENMGNTSVVKDLLRDSNNFPMKISILINTLNAWLLNDDIQSYHSEIKILIEDFNKEADAWVEENK